MANERHAEDAALLKQMADELVAMRRARARKKIDYLQAPTVLWHIGRGDIEVVGLFFEHLSRTDDIEMRAALASLGFGNWDMTIEDRMQHFAREYRVSASTARRLAEEGFQTIARLILEWSREEGNDRPLADIRLSPDENGGLLVQVECSWKDGTSMFPPTIEFLVQAPQVVEEVALHEQPGPELFRLVVRGALPKDSDERTEFCVSWLGPSECYYYIEIMPGLGNFSVASMTTKKGCDVRISHGN